MLVSQNHLKKLKTGLGVSVGFVHYHIRNMYQRLTITHAQSTFPRRHLISWVILISPKISWSFAFSDVEYDVSLTVWVKQELWYTATLFNLLSALPGRKDINSYTWYNGHFLIPGMKYDSITCIVLFYIMFRNTKICFETVTNVVISRKRKSRNLNVNKRKGLAIKSMAIIRANKSW